MERPEDGRIRSVRGFLIVDRLHQHGNSQYVRKQDELLAHVIALPACSGKEVDCRFPFGNAGAHLTNEVVKVAGQAFQNGLKARVSSVFETVDDSVSERFRT